MNLSLVAEVTLSMEGMFCKHHGPGFCSHQKMIIRHLQSLLCQVNFSALSDISEINSSPDKALFWLIKVSRQSCKSLSFTKYGTAHQESSMWQRGMFTSWWPQNKIECRGKLPTSSPRAQSLVSDLLPLGHTCQRIHYLLLVPQHWH